MFALRGRVHSGSGRLSFESDLLLPPGPKFLAVERTTGDSCNDACSTPGNRGAIGESGNLRESAGMCPSAGFTRRIGESS